MNIKDYVILALFAVAIILFFVGIFAAIKWTKKGEPGNMPPFLQRWVTRMSGVLAANLGAILGIKIEQAFTLKRNFLATFFEIPADMTHTIQLFTAGLYGVGMLIALIAWGTVRFSEDPEKVVITIPQLTRTLLGICAGAVVIVIGS